MVGSSLLKMSITFFQSLLGVYYVEGQSLPGVYSAEGQSLLLISPKMGGLDKYMIIGQILNEV